MRERDLKLEITRWLSPCDVFANFNKAICERFDGSGKWFFKSDTFWSWMARPKSFLCLRGIPGCGKTILAASIVEYLDTECLYFFFDFADKEKQTLDQLLRSLIDQLYSRAKLEGPRSVLEKEYLAGSHQRTTEQLKTILEDMLYRSQGLKIVLDTLDECSTKMDVISWLQELPFQKHQTRILVTSRSGDMTLSIASFFTTRVFLDVSSGATETDIQQYVESKVSSSNVLEPWKDFSHEERQKITTEVTKSAGGM